MTPPVLDDWKTDPWDDPGTLYEFEAERPPKRRSTLKYVVLAGVAVFVAGLLVAGAAGMWLLRQVDPPGAPKEAVNFTVDRGDTVESVAKRMQDDGIITSARVFTWYVERQGGLTLEPGYYTVRPRDTMGNILARLKTPPAQTFDKVTFPEGFTLAQMGKRLADKVPRLSADTFAAEVASGQIRSQLQPAEVTSLEGLLFPDTYQIAGNETEEAVVKRMVKLMERVAVREGIGQAPQRLGVSPYQILVIASLIEREAKVDSERPMIARVIYNRLLLGIPLQVDASLYYGQDPNTPFATLRELDSPYNLYKVKGLPPTPIANPGRASIKAALFPSSNPDPKECPGAKSCAWLYYVLADEDGNHAFATNLADHERNVARARAAGLLG
ncbi:MAG TPA: endolytic transglycosylase MltG [Acidimicrobiales bacterium]